MADKADKTPAKTEQTLPATGGWSSFDSLRREVDRLFDDFHPFSRRLPARRGLFDFDMPSLATEWRIAPAIDLVEKEKAYELTAELPGLDEKDVEVKVVGDTLTIKGEKKEEKEEKQKDYHLSERRYGSFQRSFQLPAGVDGDRIEAHFAKGVLTVSLPKTAAAQKAEKKIAIKSA